jgi:1-acyl-sn-glycerol-3-phosphate acyltransferase
VFGHIIPLKKALISIIGVLTFPRLNWINKTKISGTENLNDLPKNNVLFVSNHQTYFADVIAMIHIFCSNKWHFKNKIKNPIYLLNPKIDTYFIAAEETMKSGLLPKIFAYAGSVSIKRTWRANGQEVNRQVDMNDISNIGDALNNGWVITFPQGTTKAFAPGRRGTAHIIKKYKPIVIPVTINGFRRAFDKKGLFLKKKGVTLEVKFKAPLQLNYDEDADVLLDMVMKAIEQSDDFKNPNFNSETLEK